MENMPNKSTKDEMFSIENIKFWVQKEKLRDNMPNKSTK